MNTQTGDQFPVSPDAFGKAVARHLSEVADDLPHDISERLRAARAQAVAKRKIISAKTQTAPSVAVSGSEAALQFGGSDGSWWNRIASFLPLLALVAGLIYIGTLQDEVRTRELAEVDAELLTDDLPPAAYTDPGFTQYLRANQSH